MSKNPKSTELTSGKDLGSNGNRDQWNFNPHTKKHYTGKRLGKDEAPETGPYRIEKDNSGKRYYYLGPDSAPGENKGEDVVGYVSKQKGKVQFPIPVVINRKVLSHQKKA